MSWNRRFVEALVTAAVSAGYIFFRTLADTTDAQTLAAETGMMAFMTLAAQMGIAGVNSRRAAR